MSQTQTAAVGRNRLAPGGAVLTSFQHRPAGGVLRKSRSDSDLRKVPTVAVYNHGHPIGRTSTDGGYGQDYYSGSSHHGLPSPQQQSTPNTSPRTSMPVHPSFTESSSRSPRHSRPTSPARPPASLPECSTQTNVHPGQSMVDDAAHRSLSFTTSHYADAWNPIDTWDTPSTSYNQPPPPTTFPRSHSHIQLKSFANSTAAYAQPPTSHATSLAEPPAYDRPQTLAASSAVRSLEEAPHCLPYLQQRKQEFPTGLQHALGLITPDEKQVEDFADAPAPTPAASLPPPKLSVSTDTDNERSLEQMALSPDLMPYDLPSECTISYSNGPESLVQVDDGGVVLECNPRGCRPVYDAQGRLAPLPTSEQVTATEEYYKGALEADPQHPLLLRNYAQFVAEVLGDLVSAEKWYEKAVAVCPKDADLVAQYAKLVWELRADKAKAGALFEQALAEAPQNCYVLAAYACFLWKSEVPPGKMGGSEPAF